jgi:hypothetical protein
MMMIEAGGKERHYFFVLYFQTSRALAGVRVPGLHPIVLPKSEAFH